MSPCGTFETCRGGLTMSVVRGRPEVKTALLPSRPREFHPEPLTDPDLNLSIHPARAIDRRLPPSVELRAPPVASWPDSSSMTRPLRSTTITAASSLLRSSPPLSGASVLSALRLAPIGPSLGIAGQVLRFL